MHRVNRTSSVGLGCLLGGLLISVAGAAHADQLTYTLGSPLVKANCAGDGDNDCLDDVEENALAWIVAPNLFYDEDEDCGPRNDAVHFDRKDFYQVRPGWVWTRRSPILPPFPSSPAISTWPTNTGRKTLDISYFFLYPHDCNRWSGHQGDGEKVVYHLSSTDLVTWTVTGGTYHAHGDSYFFSGEYLAARAAEVGSQYPSVAADEDGHGSWPGKHGESSFCAGSEDSIFGSNDCFVGSFAEDYRAGRGEYAWDGEKNIGGPPPEMWNRNVVTVDQRTASVGSPQGPASVFSTFDVGHGAQKEYWSGLDQPFCGFQCATGRRSDGHCVSVNHNRAGCVGTPLSSHPNTNSFTR